MVLSKNFLFLPPLTAYTSKMTLNLKNLKFSKSEDEKLGWVVLCVASSDHPLETKGLNRL